METAENTKSNIKVLPWQNEIHIVAEIKQKTEELLSLTKQVKDILLVQDLSEEKFEELNTYLVTARTNYITAAQKTIRVASEVAKK